VKYKVVVLPPYAGQYLFYSNTLGSYSLPAEKVEEGFMEELPSGRIEPSPPSKPQPALLHYLLIKSCYRGDYDFEHLSNYKKIIKAEIRQREQKMQRKQAKKGKRAGR
jgi:hypothetical protein